MRPERAHVPLNMASNGRLQASCNMELGNQGWSLTIVTSKILGCPTTHVASGRIMPNAYQPPGLQPTNSFCPQISFSSHCIDLNFQSTEPEGRQSTGKR